MRLFGGMHLWVIALTALTLGLLLSEVFTISQNRQAYQVTIYMMVDNSHDFTLSVGCSTFRIIEPLGGV